MEAMNKQEARGQIPRKYPKIVEKGEKIAKINNVEHSQQYSRSEWLYSSRLRNFKNLLISISISAIESGYDPEQLTSLSPTHSPLSN